MADGDGGVKGKGASVRLEGLWKAYGDILALRDVTLAVAPGEFVTILGPSGSGKTTTLMAVAGFVTPGRGEIYIDDRPVARLPPQARDLGMVFQSYALFPHMTVADNIAFPLRMRRMSRAEVARRVSAALEIVQLPGYERRLPRQLSGGQQQRVALARAVVFEPRVLLMDEPLGALDKKLRERMQSELKAIQRRLKITVIYVTHDQEEALSLSDRIAVMREGRIVQVGTPGELYDAPVDAFVADFVGECNLLDGVVTAVRGDGTVELTHPSGLRFRAARRSTVEPGAAVLASVRPERLAVAAGAAPDGGGNRWSGRVAEIVYAGDATKYRVTVADLTLTVKVQNRDGGPAPAIGDVVDVRWHPAHTRLLGEGRPDDGPPAAPRPPEA